MSQNKKLYIKTFGCQMNEYDSKQMINALQQVENYDLTDDPIEASVIIFNTCSIREKAQEKVFSDLGRIKHLKQKNPDLIIGVGGCVASQEGATIIKRAPFVDIVFSPQTLHRIPEMIRQKINTGKSQVDISFPEIEKFDNLPPAQIDGVSAFISIMEGCSKYCSYCVVPYTRGEEISRPIQDILREITSYVTQGAKEIHLLGQNVNAYRDYPDDDTEIDFTALLEYIHAIDEIKRIRYTTSHPIEMSNRLIESYARLPKLVNHLHLPVQSGSDKILSLMKRGYTTLEYKSILRRIRQIRPNISYSSDFIIGFPNETEEDFQKTIQLIEEIKFDTSFSFVFSPRPGTPASNLLDSTPSETKLARLHIVQRILSQQAMQISENMIGTVQPILVERISKKDNTQLTVRTENYKVVHFTGDVELIGSIVNITITDAMTNSLLGVLLP